MSTDRNRHLIKNYGITQEDFDRMLAEQGGVCAVCRGVSRRKDGTTENLCVDHSHRSGKNRALLCRRCNRLLGMVNDSQELLFRLLEYVRKHEGSEIPFVEQNAETEAAREKAFLESLSGPPSEPSEFE